MKTVLVTGATGYLGSYLARHLVDANYRVVILKRSTSDTTRIDKLLSQSHVKAYDVDRVNIECPFHELNEIDGVIHAATSYGRDGESMSDIFYANTVFPLNLLETAVNHHVAWFVNTDTVLKREVNAYAMSKAQFVEWGRYTAHQKPIRFLNLKLEHFYGPLDDISKFTTYVIRNCLNNVECLKLTAGEQQRDFIYIDDVVTACATLLDNMAELSAGFHEFEIGTGHAIRIREFVELVHQLAGSCTRLEFGALPYRINELMTSQANISMIRSLGWEPVTDLVTGIRKTIEQEKIVK